MARLPIPGSDKGTWGNILNDYLSTSHGPDGTLKDNVVGSAQLADNAVTDVAIADGSITETLLDTNVQTKLNAVAPTWSTLSGKPAVIAAGADIATAREAIDGDTYGAYSANRNGTNDDRAILASADTAAATTNKPLLLLAGTHLVNSDLAFSSPVIFRPGAIIKPANGVTVTFNKGVVTDGLYQIFDHSAGGKCVPLKVSYYHPAWWGQTGTSDDSQTWKDMLLAAQAYSAWQPTQQRVLVPQGYNKIFNIEVNHVHLEGNGRSSWIIAPSTATAGDPVNSNDGYILRLKGTTTLEGLYIEANIPGITAIYWTGSEVYITNCQLALRGANTIGIWTWYQSGVGASTPKIVNTNIFGITGTDAETSGTGLKSQSHDGELIGGTIHNLQYGINNFGSNWVITATHIYSCYNGYKGTGYDTRFVGSMFANCDSWGANFDQGAIRTIFDATTRFWDNGKTVASTGGLYIKSDGTNVADNRIDAMFDDNYGTSLYLDGALRTTGNIKIVSTAVQIGNAARTTDGIVINSTTVGTDIHVDGLSSYVTNLIVNNQNSSQSRVAYSSVPTYTVTAAGTTTLTTDSSTTQVFTGSSTQTVLLPADVTTGQEWLIINQSAGTVNVNSSTNAYIWSVPSGRTGRFIAEVANPVSSSDWSLFVSASPTAYAPYSTALRDVNGNLFAVNFITGKNSVATAAGTTTLTVGDYQVQEFTGSTTQTVKLPTASVMAGQTWTIINNSTGTVTVQSSDGSAIVNLLTNRQAVFMAKFNTPTASSHWTMLTTTLSTGTFSPTSLALRDANSNISASNFIAGRNSVVTAGGTTTLTVGDYQVQVFTGSTTQTVKLPTTSVTAGMEYRIINNSTGAVTVQSSNGSTVATVTASTLQLFIALVDTPTTAANWRAI